MDRQPKWEHEFSECGAYWKHDGNPLRPHARLTSGLISNGFFDAGRVASERPYLLHQASRELLSQFQERHRDEVFRLLSSRNETIRVIGAAYGGIALSTLIAGNGSYKCAFAVKQDNGTLAFSRTTLAHNEHLVMVEDTITTGGTLAKLKDAASAASPQCHFFSTVLALCNRSGSSHWNGHEILSLIQPDFQIWKEGESPFTPDGQELVPPVRPKTNWLELTQNYQ